MLKGGSGVDVLHGGGGNDRLEGGTGDDFLYGDDGNDVLLGGKDDDFLLGGKGNDKLYGGDDEDVLSGGPGKDVNTGGKGSDIVDTSDGDIWKDRSADDFMTYDGNFILIGTYDAWTKNKKALGKFLGSSEEGDKGWLTRFEKGFIYQEGESITLVTGGVFDRVKELGSKLGNFKSLTTSGKTTILTFAKGAVYGQTGSAASYLYNSKTETLAVTGTSGADAIEVYGSGKKLRISWQGAVVGEFEASSVERIEVDGMAGDDTITVRGLAIRSVLRGGEGNDTLTGGEGDDSLFGEAGKDTLVGGKGDDYLRGGDNDDSLDGGAGKDTLAGEGGTDRYLNVESKDTIYAGVYPITGAIALKWLELGGERSLLGNATAAAFTIDGVTGQRFENGGLFKPGRGEMIHIGDTNSTWDRYVGTGGEKGPLGVPTKCGNRL